MTSPSLTPAGLPPRSYRSRLTASANFSLCKKIRTGEAKHQAKLFRISRGPAPIALVSLDKLIVSIPNSTWLKIV